MSMIDALPVRHRPNSADMASRLWLFSFANGIGEFAKHKTVADVPGDSWNLSYAISKFRDGSRDFRRHLNNSKAVVIAGRELLISIPRIRIRPQALEL